MLTKSAVIEKILSNKISSIPARLQGEGFAAANIALSKYWGKRDTELNLPMTSSVSISLAHKGAAAEIHIIDAKCHELFVNGILLDATQPHTQQLIAFLDAFQPTSYAYRVKLRINIPVAAGLASSACIFAALVKALDQLHEWKLHAQTLSILARLGSGSAARSIETGFVEWQRGSRPDGMDSYGIPLPMEWPELQIGLCIITAHQKSVSSREGMQRTVETSPLYPTWLQKTEKDLIQIKTAILEKNFDSFGKTAESNALALHATLQTAWPPLMYTQPETLAMMQQIWALRQAGLSLYFTQDAGPNLKLLFLESDRAVVKKAFPHVEILCPFQTENRYS